MNGLKRIDNIFKREYILERKLNNYIYNHVEYDDATISEMREYAEKKNTRLKEKYEDDEYTFKISGIYDYNGSLCIFMPQEELNRTFDLGDDYFSGYFSNSEITDIDSSYIGSVIDLDALTKIELQEELLKIRERFHNTMLMVTHDIEEAVYLADRIVVMSARPGRIKDVIKVELGTYRDRGGSDFAHYKKKIFDYFFEEKTVVPEYNI